MSEKVLSKEQVASIQRFGTDFHHEATVDEGMVLGHWHGSKRALTLGDVFDSHEALRAERDAALAGIERLRAQVRETVRRMGVASGRKFIPEARITDADVVEQAIVTTAVEVKRLRAEVERMRPVYDAAWRFTRANGIDGKLLARLCATLEGCSPSASAQKEGK